MSSIINLSGLNVTLVLSSLGVSINASAKFVINPLKTKIDGITADLQTVNAVLGVSKTKVGALDTTVDANKTSINAIRTNLGMNTIV
jgi:hypothetical protein